MRLSAPKTITWWIAVILGVFGLLGSFGLPVVGGFAFWLAFLGFALLALATAMDGL